MATSPSVILFDYGNTLISFGPVQQKAQRDAMQDVLYQAFGTCDDVQLETLRKEQVLRPYRNGYVENDWDAVCLEVIETLFPGKAQDSLVAELQNARFQAFLDSVHVTAPVVSLLEELQQTYRLGLLSNYPCARSIRESMDTLGLSVFFDAVVVSAEVGRVKPHEDAYRAILREMDVEATDCVYVGDNWLADIQGAKRMGMRAIYLQEHTPYETFAVQDGDYEADATIDVLTALSAALKEWS